MTQVAKTAEAVPVIELYADVWCQFAYLGLRTVARRREEMGWCHAVLRVRPWPLELVNGAPLDPAITARHVGEHLLLRRNAEALEGFLHACIG